MLAQLGGRILPGDLWRKLAGMREEKVLIENRVIAPLTNPEAARDHGVQPPHGLLLFGPPGTGKTSFARAIASRLGLAVRRDLPVAPGLPRRWARAGVARDVRADRDPGAGRSCSSTRSRRSPPPLRRP